MTFDNLFSGILYGPRGPETKRLYDDTWGATMEKAMAGNDNEDFIDKTLILSKYTFPVATLFAIVDIIGINNKGGLPVALQRMKWHYTPWLGASVAYTAGVNLSSNLRGGKSDHKNHVVGGFCAGAVVGKCARHFLTGALTGGFLAFIGWIYKDSAIKGYNLFSYIGEKPSEHGNPFTHKLDMTYHNTNKWMGERPGYWCRSPEEVEKVYKRGQLSDGNSTDRLW